MATSTNQAKNSATLDTMKEAGFVWAYDKTLFTYNMPIFEGKLVHYESVGLVSTSILQTKNTALLSNQIKN